jgi:cell wall-associated NlpC family hydrolase
MQYAAAITSVAHIRAEPSHKSEIVSQLLFGEAVVIKNEKKEFTEIISVYDNYEGWVQNSQLEKVNAAFAKRKPDGYITEHNVVAMRNNALIRLPLGAPVFWWLRNIGNIQVSYKKAYSKTQEERLAFVPENIEKIACLYINTPYLWGGKSNLGIDCSGFTQQVFKQFGIALKRDVSQQVTEGEIVGFLQSAACGDLAFFDNEEGKMVHVGILLSNAKIIHAAGWVRIDAIDNEGIINKETKLRTHKLRMVKRMKSI